MMYLMRNLNIIIFVIAMMFLGGLQGCSIEDRTVYLNCPSVDEMTKAYDVCMTNSLPTQRSSCSSNVKQLLCEKKIIK